MTKFKMRFSIQEQNGKKMIFHSPAEAHKVTGVHSQPSKTTLERGANPFTIESLITNFLKSGKKTQSDLS